VIGVAVALDQATAAGADEVLDSTGEAAAHLHALNPDQKTAPADQLRLQVSATTPSRPFGTRALVTNICW
jgi:hypothetical protein